MPPFDKIKEEGKRVTGEVREKVTGYILAALGLVAGLAWNEAIKALIEYFFPVSGGGLLAKFVYALFISFAVVVVSVYLARIMQRKP
ncbi:MAG: hypothetical protein UY92_C0005G0010 [Candidatus Magasanikbacteria bacterium GW2011_GWA2_56_11]|uniref:Uncharacterized protein n=1 Tax=Candidatus Magasanikbacteria bacterium GW2011_GWA2_56_11 TaxID=1619044 RepID=A0A0G1YGL7_9BACT|nr:MAG: hypothetical protein UY92_C0005G0010 [Candidatus Magasanikbacteria bacterium GW2011_GWA2_56_11]